MLEGPALGAAMTGENQLLYPLLFVGWAQNFGDFVRFLLLLLQKNDRKGSRFGGFNSGVLFFSFFWFFFPPACQRTLSPAIARCSVSFYCCTTPSGLQLDLLLTSSNWALRSTFIRALLQFHCGRIIWSTPQCCVWRRDCSVVSHWAKWHLELACRHKSLFVSIRLMQYLLEWTFSNKVFLCADRSNIISLYCMQFNLADWCELQLVLISEVMLQSFSPESMSWKSYSFQS